MLTAVFYAVFTALYYYGFLYFIVIYSKQITFRGAYYGLGIFFFILSAGAAHTNT